uniref:ribosomal protein S18-alanine N-acetyltransferase n=1 Tax=Thaumasiovibrio occultus TaxID=1891184 RepID=UPI0018644054|nr:ribosomal protein S18-alanine N-acetyltransferase [Thaumasiovibrio occultus]
MAISLHLVPMTEQHHDQVWAIEQQAHAYPWSESLIRQTPSKIGFNRVWVEQGNVLGYFYGQQVAGEATLLNVAVAPEQQGKGIGRQLVEAFMAEAAQLGGEEGWLEVRESNERAYRLYEALGFNEIDRRDGYYPTKNGREAALVMTCFLADNPFA